MIINTASTVSWTGRHWSGSRRGLDLSLKGSNLDMYLGLGGCGLEFSSEIRMFPELFKKNPLMSLCFVGRSFRHNVGFVGMWAVVFPGANDSDINQQTSLVTTKHLFDARNMKWISKAALGYVLWFAGIVLNSGRERFQVLLMLLRFSPVCHFNVAPQSSIPFIFILLELRKNFWLWDSFFAL